MLVNHKIGVIVAMVLSKVPEDIKAQQVIRPLAQISEVNRTFFFLLR